MGKMHKLFPDGAVKRAGGPIHGYAATGGGDGFCIKIRNDHHQGLGHDGYVMRLSQKEARKLHRRLGEYLENPEAAIALARQWESRAPFDDADDIDTTPVSNGERTPE